MWRGTLIYGTYIKRKLLYFHAFFSNGVLHPPPTTTNFDAFIISNTPVPGLYQDEPLMVVLLI